MIWFWEVYYSVVWVWKDHAILGIIYFITLITLPSFECLKKCSKTYGYISTYFSQLMVVNGYRVIEVDVIFGMVRIWDYHFKSYHLFQIDMNFII